MLDALLHDVRYTIRSLRRSPGFSCVVIVTLALAIGTNTALFSLVNAIVLRPLPVREPSRLAAITVTGDRGQQRFIYASTFDEFSARQHAFDAVSMYAGGGILRVEARGAEVDAGVEGAMPEYFDMLGVRPLLGRLITKVDAPTASQAAPVVVLGHRLWLRLFGGDPAALGETLRVDGFPFTIIGVTPPEFQGVTSDAGADFFVPVPTLRQVAGDPNRPPRARNLIGRLRAGVKLEQARAETRALWTALQATTMTVGLTAVEQTEFRTDRVNVESIATGFSYLRQSYANPLFVLLGLTMVLLAIGCVNLSGLLLSRAIARGEQLAVRVALGASRARLVQQVLVESLMLSVMGTFLALPLAWWASRLVGALLIGESLVPLARSMTPDARVLTVTAIVACGTGLLVGVLPAWLATRRRAIGNLQSARTIAASTGRSGKMLLVVQVALSLVLLVFAGLFTRSLANLHANDASFSKSRIVWTRLWLKPGERDAALDGAYYSELARQFSQVPGVESVGLSMNFPAAFNARLTTETIAPADARDQSSDTSGITEVASPRFFETVGITRLRGRDFTWNDDARGTPVAIVNSTLASTLFAARDPVGRRIRIGSDPAHRAIEIVGVVGDAAVGNIREPHVPVAFRPMLQEPQRARVPILHVRTRADLKTVGEAYSRIVPSMGHHFVRTVQTLEEQVDRALLQERLVAALSSFFAGLAVLLASVGVYGLLSYDVARRTREIGVRMALGATRRSVIGTIMWEGLALALTGVGVGIPAALAAGRFVRALLYGLAPNDPATLVVAAGAFIVVAVCAGLLPAYRASSIDPMTALRHD